MCKENIIISNQNENRDFKHEHRERLCYCCDTLQESKDQICIYKIEGRRYGSIFDGSKIEIHLCDKCKQKIKEEWFTEKAKIVNKYCEEYQFEDNIREFVDNNFIVENQEYLYNAPNVLDVPSYKLSREEWIEQNKTDMILKENDCDNILINKNNKSLFEYSHQIILNNNNNIKANYIN